MTDAVVKNGRRALGFTLLEVMVALSIIAAALMALSDLSGNALRNHAYAHQLSQATLLARGKMAELEEKFEDQGFKDFDETEEGDFADTGHPEFKWRVDLKKPESDLSPEQLLGHLTGTAGDDAQSIVATLMGAGTKDGQGSSPTAAPGLAGAAMSNLVTAQLTTFGEQIKKSLREMRLTTTWVDGRIQRQFTVVTHLVVLNPRAPGGVRGESPDAPPGISSPPRSLQTPAAGEKTGEKTKSKPEEQPRGQP